jgi:DNA primase
MNETITLSSYMRALLLEEICRRMDIIDYCKYTHNLLFKRCIKNTYTGDCPFCSGHQAFAINSTTGKIYCMACKQEGDFLVLMSKLENIDLNSTLNRLSGYLKGEEKRKKAYAGGAV